MDTFKIDTSQNIEIEHTVASIGERIAASLLDLTFIIGYSILVGFLANLFESSFFTILAFFPVGLYDLISETSMNGQTWGKRILQIKVVKTDGTPASFSNYFLRWVIRLVEIVVTFGTVATISIIINQKGQRIGDIAAGTAVIRLRKKSLKPKIYTQLPEDYQAVHPEVSRLSTNDIYTIKEIIELLESTTYSKPAVHVAQKAREAIERKMEVKGDRRTMIFFQTILRDYNFINRDRG
jgi:uncharacterized RDD family membrane protein YckC